MKHYDNNTERLINALCDNTVPEHLNFEESSVSAAAAASITFDDEKPFISKDSFVLGQRLNVYDNDEFDVFNQDNVDLSRIHRGKKLVVLLIIQCVSIF